MAFTSDARDKWNAEHYTQVKIYADPKLAADFKATCSKRGDSMATVLSRAMAEYCGSEDWREKKKQTLPAQDYSTREKRRTAVKRMAVEFEKIKDAEEAYKEKIPENMTNKHETAEEAIEKLETALDAFADAF